MCIYNSGSWPLVEHDKLLSLFGPTRRQMKQYDYRICNFGFHQNSSSDLITPDINKSLFTPCPSDEYVLATLQVSIYSSACIWNFLLPRRGSLMKLTDSRESTAVTVVNMKARRNELAYAAITVEFESQFRTFQKKRTMNHTLALIGLVEVTNLLDRGSSELYHLDGIELTTQSSANGARNR